MMPVIGGVLAIGYRSYYVFELYSADRLGFVYEVGDEVTNCDPLNLIFESVTICHVLIFIISNKKAPR